MFPPLRWLIGVDSDEPVIVMAFVPASCFFSSFSGFEFYWPPVASYLTESIPFSFRSLASLNQLVVLPAVDFTKTVFRWRLMSGLKSRLSTLDPSCCAFPLYRLSLAKNPGRLCPLGSGCVCLSDAMKGSGMTWTGSPPSMKVICSFLKTSL